MLRSLAAFGLLFTFIVSATAGDFLVDSRAEIGLMKRKIRAAQFLNRATFGADEEQINELADRMRQIGIARACSEWIDNQFAMPASLHEPLIETMLADDQLDPTQGDAWVQRYRWYSWYHNALTADDQLRQRTAWALSQILVTSEAGAGFNDRGTGFSSGTARWIGLTNYYDIMVRQAFGNYRDILEEVTYHPIMGTYLSHLRNRKTDLASNRFPDENYAREIMQLFTVGLYDLHVDGRLKTDDQGNLIPTYDNEAIREFAKVFTGLSFIPHPDATSTTRFWWGNDFQYPMQMMNWEHEPGTKTLLNGQVVGSESTIDGDADVQGALDNLMAHDNIAPFLARRLIQRFVNSNPSRAYIRRVARKFNDNGQGVKGDLKAVIKQILLDPEVWRGQRIRTLSNPQRVSVVTRGTEYSRLEEPVIRYTKFLRGVHAESNHHSGRMLVLPMSYNWSQDPYRSPSVFNFYLPDYQPGGEMLTAVPSRRVPNGFYAAPEFQLLTPVVANRLTNRYIWDTSAGFSQQNWNGENFTTECQLVFQLQEEHELADSDDNMIKLMDKFDLVFCNGSLPQDYKEKCVQVINTETAWMVNNTTWRPRMGEIRTECALRAVLLSPYCAVTE